MITFAEGLERRLRDLASRFGRVQPRAAPDGVEEVVLLPGDPKPDGSVGTSRCEQARAAVKATRVRHLGSGMNEPVEKPIRAETGEELDALVEEHDLVLAEFYTKGCARCNAIEPVLGNVARATDVVVVMINPVTDLSLVEEYDVTSVPALVLFEDGERVGHLTEGFQGTEELLEFIEEHASRDPTEIAPGVD